jgi:hypothetical protein
VLSGRYIVRGLESLLEVSFEEHWIGALNWATGETVAVKEIQLSAIPKSELGEIMVSSASISEWLLCLMFPLVRD